MSISSGEAIKMSLNLRLKDDKWESDVFPLMLSNMGGKGTKEELVDFSLHDTVDVYFFSKNERIIPILRDNVELFFCVFNFGQRATKGFGSFTVKRIEGDENRKEIYDLLNIDTPFLKFKFQSLQQIFEVIDFYWKCLKSGINYTKGDKESGRYIKSFLWKYYNNILKDGSTWEKRMIKQSFNLTTGSEVKENPNEPKFVRGAMGCPEFYEYKNKGSKVAVKHICDEKDDNFIARIPSPIYFKPEIVGDVAKIYILVDKKVEESLKNVNNRTFKFSCGGKSINIDLPSSINYSDLLTKYHSSLANPNFTEEEKINYEDNLQRNFRRTLPSTMKWFIALNFKWQNILGNQIVSINTIKR